MIKALILGILFLINTAHAKVVEKAPAVETPNVQSELLNELEDVSEDLDFDEDDEFLINTIDENELIIDSEIEKIAAEKATPAPKVEAKAPSTTDVKKK
ncbi:MAG: hypothetical protein IT287_03730 [Bdellovibrionaceae bacterium]|nr:hypothetical protein [Pseudobdellovibrionaceae bacterium]